MALSEPIAQEPVVAWVGSEARPRSDVLAVEEPLEIRLAGLSVAVTMRTPGNDLDLAAGFLYTEGIIRGPDDIASIGHCPGESAEGESNVVNINPHDPALVDPARWQRTIDPTSACGVCGKTTIERIYQRAAPLKPGLRLSHHALYRAASRLGSEQRGFAETGGLHAAALADREGQLLVVREDIGRHNAVDKVIGAALRRDLLPLSEVVLLVSSRVSFEIVQKALVAGIPVVAGVSAASSLGVQLAREAGMTLIGFLRPADGGRFNVYAGESRVLSSSL